ncbi:hypothetical protein FIBSPDRAFT_956387 [Athelia psychrophila]|uniref:N-acetyltransferase domain-containing protein n=1 Tax=Athelia psychrophila TaxID=1759441 RepID=A0A166H2A6_9AGAM|nr:hypothetical protein FIBSPDRAFT_956387 [Fibularhizoctonia sp. CBS 109695]
MRRLLKRANVLSTFVVMIHNHEYVAQTVDTGSSVAFGKKKPVNELLKKLIPPSKRSAQKSQNPNSPPSFRPRWRTESTTCMMWYLNILFTAPECQGRGYAGAVLGSVTALADAQNRATWLASSNVLDREFYNSQGFNTAGTITIGRGDADWHKAPVVLDLSENPEPLAGAYVVCSEPEKALLLL